MGASSLPKHHKAVVATSVNHLSLVPVEKSDASIGSISKVAHKHLAVEILKTRPLSPPQKIGLNQVNAATNKQSPMSQNLSELLNTTVAMKSLSKLHVRRGMSKEHGMQTTQVLLGNWTGCIVS